MTEAQSGPSPGQTVAGLESMAISMRLATLDEMRVAGSGHLGPAFSCMDILVSLYYGYLRVRPEEPEWTGRDRFLLGKGHAVSALYPILADLGFFPSSELETFTELGSRLGDHPDMRKVPGIDFSSGSLGHALSIGTGMADGLRIRGLDARVVILLGDGELNEGQIWEAAGYASHRRLGHLLAIVDANQVCVDGKTADLLSYEPIDGRFAAFGWEAERVNGHDFTALRAAYARYDERRRHGGARPTVLVADTVAGKGIGFIEGMAEWHVGFLGDADLARAASSIRSMFAGQKGS